jgi:predicted lipoprotein with Yx(FWY)xxD motif
MMNRTSHRSLIPTVAALPLIALAAAGCGGGGDNNGTTAASGTTATASGQSGTVSAKNEDGLGTILVDSQGLTLYLFEKDSGSKSSCFGGCAAAWPPLRASGKATAGSGANSSLVGTTSRSDGQPQVTYNSHPLYHFAGDQSPGDVNGQGLTEFGGGWFALNGAGDAVTTKPAGGNTSSSGGGLPGY